MDNLTFTKTKFVFGSKIQIIGSEKIFTVKMVDFDNKKVAVKEANRQELTWVGCELFEIEKMPRIR